MPTVTAKSAANTDDGNVDGAGGSFSTAGLIYMWAGGYYGGFWAFFRFPLAVPKAATITAATIALVRNAAWSDIAGGTFGVENVDDSAAPSTGANMIGRSFTGSIPASATSGAAGTSWTVNVTSLVQAVVNRSGWVSGNRVLLRHLDPSSFASAVARGRDYDSGGAQSPTLTVTYEAAGTPTGPEPGRRLLLAA